ncbi:MAG: hypothetical protein TREMPRED_001310 [Tremellales sp. Tagirdzhanova-0007]|nr:MAG: hypothetical protein TREMPRED_001310 [Tremellales sp. Tagirdzhanova-0007]
MLSVAREEVAVISTELVASTRTSVAEGVTVAARTAETEAMNPIGIRQMVETSIKQHVGGTFMSPDVMPLSSFSLFLILTLGSESTILSHHLSHLQPTPSLPPSLTLDNTVLHSNNHFTNTARTLERDLGVNIREAISNAGQTGAEEQMDQVADVAKAMTSGHGKGGLGQVQITAVA